MPSPDLSKSMGLKKEVKGLKTLGSLREMETSVSAAYISLWGSMGIMKKLNCLFYKPPQTGWSSSWSTLLC